MSSYALVHTAPAIKDPRELNTIISTSIRSMFGDCQSHATDLLVLGCRPCSKKYNLSNSNSYEAIIKCQTKSLPYVRAALTFPSPPVYLSDTLYCIDFVETVAITTATQSKPKWAEWNEVE